MKYLSNTWFVLAVFCVVLFAVVQIGCGYAVKWAYGDITSCERVRLDVNNRNSVLPYSSDTLEYCGIYAPVTYTEPVQGVLIGEAIEYPPCDVEGLEYISGWCVK